MGAVTALLWLAIGLGLGLLIGLLAGLAARRRSLGAMRSELMQKAEALAETEGRLGALRETESRLKETFTALSSQVIGQHLDLARGELDQRRAAVDNLVRPLSEALKGFDERMRTVEQERRESFGSLRQLMEGLGRSQDRLAQETGNLVQALRRPQVRGRWGEMTLKRVVELAGMTEYCDFDSQVSVTTEDGRLRPDMIVRLPSDRIVVVDAKTPLDAYLGAIEATDPEVRAVKLKDHARQMREHLSKLGQKAYWDQFDSTPEFVVMFVPGESFFSAALGENPELIQQGVNERVILATPTTLIALLKAVAYGWRQERMAENAAVIANLGRELYDRLAVLAEHFEKLRRSLSGSVEAYNKVAASLESRVLVTARKFGELGVGGKGPIAEIGDVDRMPRSLAAPETATASLDESESE